MAIGKKLEEARNRKGISIREASESTKIRGDFLSAFEEGRFDVNLPEVYLRGFIRVYARFLGIDPESAVADLSLELGTAKAKSARKPLGKISAGDNIENQQDLTNEHRSPISRSSKKSPSLQVILIISIVSIVLLLAISLFFVFTSGTDDSSVENEVMKSDKVRETSQEIMDDALVESGNSFDDERLSSPAELTLTLAAMGSIDRLIISDEGKNPKVFHEFRNIEKGWEKSITFTSSFRCYSSSLEHVRFAVNDGLEKQVNGKGPGNFSWKP